MTRIRYTKTDVPGVLLSTSLYTCTDGRQVRVKLVGSTAYEILDESGALLQNGGSKRGSATYLKRLAKLNLLKMTDPTSFQKETRQKRQSI